MEINQKYYIKLTAITPLSVGAGNEEEWVKCVDYVIKDNKVYVLDLRKIAEYGFDILKLTNYFLNSDHKGIISMLGNKVDEVSLRIFDLPCSTDNNIKAMSRSQLHDVPVVPGSSLKGTLRSILFSHLRTDERAEKDVFGKMNDGTEFMRFIRVSDIEVQSSKLFNTKIFNLHGYGNEWEGGWKHALREGTSNVFRPTGFNTLYECLSPGDCGIGSLMMSPKLFDILLNNVDRVTYVQEKREIVGGGLAKLFAIINKHTRNYLLKEKAFFEKYPAERSEEILDCICRLIGMIPNDNSTCLLKMSAGVGFHSITGDWQYDDYSATGTDSRSGKKKYKSRKIADTPRGLTLMGFVMLSSSSSSEYKKNMLRIESVCSERLQPSINRNAAEMAAEEQRRIAEIKLREDYDALIEEAETLESSGNYIDAIGKAYEARSLYPLGNKHSVLIARCTPKAEIQKVIQEEKQRIDKYISFANGFIENALWNDALGQLAQAKELAEHIDYKINVISELVDFCNKKKGEKDSEPLSEILKGKTSIGNIAGTTKKWRNKNEFTQVELDVLVSCIKALPAKEQKNLDKKKKDFVKAIGDDWTDKLYDKLGL